MGNPALVQNTTRTWKLRLRVQPAGEQPFEADVHAHLGQFETMSPGMELSVLYDPDDHSKVAIDHSQGGLIDTMAQRIAGNHPGTDPAALAALLMGRVHDPDGVSTMDIAAAIPGARTLGSPATPAAPGAEDPVELLTKLATLHDHGVLDDAEFAAQKARLLGQGGSAT